MLGENGDFFSRKLKQAESVDFNFCKFSHCKKIIILIIESRLEKTNKLNVTVRNENIQISIYRSIKKIFHYAIFQKFFHILFYHIIDGGLRMGLLPP